MPLIYVKGRSQPPSTTTSSLSLHCHRTLISVDLPSPKQRERLGEKEIESERMAEYLIQVFNIGLKFLFAQYSYSSHK